MKFFRSPPTVYNAPRSFKVNFTGRRTEEERLTYPSNFIKTSRYLPQNEPVQVQPHYLFTLFAVELVPSLRKYLFLGHCNYSEHKYNLSSQSVQCDSSSSFRTGSQYVERGLLILGFEDVQRHRSDNEVNATQAILHQSRTPEKVKWADIMVGDLVLVEENDAFPADLIVLGSSIESGVCYIETGALDGEKNLKPKSALKDTQDIFQGKDRYQEIDITVDGQQPSQALYEFEGSIRSPDIPKQLSLGPKQLLLRGAYLRNTHWILGVAIYTGEDTKIMRNAEPGRQKVSEIESTMNTLILSILCLQFSLCIVSAALNSSFQNMERDKHWYLQYSSVDYSPNLTAFIVLFSYFLLYNTMIPISLIVSLEFVKVFQSYFINNDEEMYTASRDKWASVKTTTINEELGQVEYIFSDKTGTLTCNQMEFKYCIIGDILYGESQEPHDKDIRSQRVENYTSTALHKSNLAAVHPDPRGPKEHVPAQLSIFNFKDTNLEDVISGRGERAKLARNLTLKSSDGMESLLIQTQKDLVHYYLFLLCSAHECIFQLDKNNNPIYQGPSPDEITLVDAASHLGFQFLGSSASEQTFKILGQDHRVELKYLFEFDSDRKRMSVIIRFKNEKFYRLLVKGADSIIKSRLSNQKDQIYLPYIEGELDRFSKVGLRCLLMATKILSEREYKTFEEKMTEAIDSPDRQKLILNLTNDLERDLMLVGATAVEDKLQPMVPETIADLLRANIKVWMLTGDKLETAENIAKSCSLIQGDMNVMRVAVKTTEEMEKTLSDCTETYDLCVKKQRKKSLLVDGDSLGLILQSDVFMKQFVYISKGCESVVCCRVTPKQKAQVVKLIKDNLNKITLAIGDGANDCNMIQEAHIGIGLYGNEGMRAVQSADFALGEFRCLWRLLLVHGHWSYIRISEMILYFFYKNMIFTVPQFFFAFFSAFSAQSIFDDWYITFYNMLFTALPLIIRATFDQDLNYRTKATLNPNDKDYELQKKQEEYLRNKFPNLYYVGQQKTIFTIPNFVFWSFQGALQGLIVFLSGVACFETAAVHVDGFTVGLPGFGITLLTAVIFIVDIKISLFTKFWTWLNFVSLIVFSVLLYFIYTLFSQTIIGTLSLYTPFTLFKTPHFWLLIILLCGIVFLFDMVYGQVIREVFKESTDNLKVFVKHFDLDLKRWHQLHEQNNDKQPLSKGEGAELGRINSFWDQVLKEEEEYLHQNEPRQQGIIV